jgi:nitronate monooxygenase
MRSLRNTERVLMNDGVREIMEIERNKGAALTVDDIHHRLSGVYSRVMVEGEIDVGAWSCGMVVGLINDIPSCKELIDRIMRQADQLISHRLAAFGAGSA